MVASAEIRLYYFNEVKSEIEFHLAQDSYLNVRRLVIQNISSEVNPQGLL